MTSTVVGAAANPAALQLFPQAESPCLARLNARPWGRVLAVRVGDLVVGIRARDVATADTLDDFLASIRVPSLDADVKPNFSVDLAKSASEFRRLALIYRDHDVVARRRHEADVLCDLLDLLSDIPRILDNASLAISATAIVTGKDRVTLLPGRLFKKLLVARDRLAADGFTLLNSQLHVYDAERNRLVLTSKDRGLATLQRQVRSGGRNLDALEIDKWGVPAMGNDVYRLRPAEIVYGTAASVLNRSLLGTQFTLRTLRHMAMVNEGWTFPMDVSASQAHSNLVRIQKS